MGYRGQVFILEFSDARGNPRLSPCWEDIRRKSIQGMKVPPSQAAQVTSSGLRGGAK